MNTEESPNHTTEFTPFQLEFILKMGTTPEGVVYPKQVASAVREKYSIKTVYRRLKSLRERENITKMGDIPVFVFLQYVSFSKEKFSDIIVY